MAWIPLEVVWGQIICASVSPQMSIEEASRLLSISISYFMAWSLSGCRSEAPSGGA
jgi:hypothetical protein